MMHNTEPIAELLLQAGKAHHQAFFDVDGDDAEWPLWYADYLLDKLPPLLGKTLTRSELTYQLIRLNNSFVAQNRDDQWNRYYAQLLVEQYRTPSTPDSAVLANSDDIPVLTTKQMVEVDRAMIEEFQINLTQMMENAGRNLAHLARQRFLDNDPRGKHVVVLSGTGGNGGGALVAARRLANYGASVSVVTTRTVDFFRTVPGHQLSILKQMKIPIYQEITGNINAGAIDLIIDGIIGYSLRGAPRGSAAAFIHWANSQDAPVLALDVPSGIDGTMGHVHDPSIKAAATLTLALPKVGLVHDNAATNVGELYLADISVPPALYAGSGIELKISPIFAHSDIVRLR